MLIIGHRGAKGYEPENTLDSFQKAIDLGCDGIELDVHLSANGEAVVIHDKTVNRTTGEQGFVTDYTSSELKKFGIPELEEVFRLVNKRCFINIEIKDAHAIIAVLNLIEKLAVDLTLFQISSFNWEVLSFCYTNKQRISLGVLTDNSIEKALAFAKSINAYSINPYYKLLDKETVTLMHQNGFLVFPFTVNEPADIENMKLYNVDGIISDFPDRV